METFRTIALAALVAWFLVVTIVNWKNSSTGRHYKTNSDYREADRRTPIATPEFIREEIADGEDKRDKNVHQSTANDPAADEAAEKDAQGTSSGRRPGRSVQGAEEDPAERHERAEDERGDSAMSQKKTTTTFIKTCKGCGKTFETHKQNVRYCSAECRENGHDVAISRVRAERIERNKAKKGMSGIKTGKLDERLEEAREKGLSYAELQKQKTLEKIRKGEL